MIDPAQKREKHTASSLYFYLCLSHITVSANTILTSNAPAINKFQPLNGCFNSSTAASIAAAVVHNLRVEIIERAPNRYLPPRSTVVATLRVSLVY
jgi:hypothetical protein